MSGNSVSVGTCGATPSINGGEPIGLILVIFLDISVGFSTGILVVQLRVVVAGPLLVSARARLRIALSPLSTYVC